ncbi:insulin gene enhancer protein ISL-1-like [Pristis pectinata]|uniref:insulin gene enhancer protein ISL-1-like n=1 Tax=Pristis pectinata TaxID=685728 RepID=UPI00223E5193|nr:insulin gene enhancer protein ISL-1-like [Pristis pectinata]
MSFALIAFVHTDSGIRQGLSSRSPTGQLLQCGCGEALVSTCVGCSKHITDPYILKVYPDLEWHAACLRCVECNQNLDESCTCFFREGKIYCKIDYFRKFSVRCAQCQAGLLSSDLVLRARGLTYHQQCFCCVACNRQLLPGDEFRLRLDGPYCIQDGGLPDTSSHQEGPLSSPADTGNLYLSEKFKAYQSTRHAAKHPDKITRVRTVLNEQQLLTLRTCYAANPRPDALMKQQLIEMTGLSSRVIRVWFQNKRCKDKKKSVLQKHTDQFNRDKMDIRGLVGTLMVAMSPLPQKGDLQCSPIEVHKCHPPWEDLKDFTLQEGFSGGQSHSNCSSSEVSTLSSQLSDMLNSEESQTADL